MCGDLRAAGMRWMCGDLRAVDMRWMCGDLRAVDMRLDVWRSESGWHEAGCVEI